MTSPSTASTVLVADIGGTFARFCPMRGGQALGTVLTFPRASADDLPSLCSRARQAFQMPIDGIAIAIAAPVAQGRARMTNADWTVDEQDLSRALALERVLLLNDFAALTLSLPILQSGDMLPIPPGQGADACLGSTTSQEMSVVFGPGTGLGVAALARRDGRDIPLASEGGHIGFSPSTPFEQKVLERAATLFERVSWERILSGPGLELIDEVSQIQLEVPGNRRDAAQIITAARDGTCAAASRSIECFAGLLGSFGGDLALMFGASGGVFIGGGIVTRVVPLLALPFIRERFCRKGRFSPWLAALPLVILKNPNATLYGAARAFAERFDRRPEPPNPGRP